MKRNMILVPTVSLILAGGAAFSAQALSSNHSPNRDSERRPSYSQPVKQDPLPGYLKTLCDNGNRLYVNKQTGDIAVAAQDPTCGTRPTQSDPRPTWTSTPTRTSTSSPTRTSTSSPTRTTPGNNDPRGNDPRGNDPRGGNNDPRGNDPRGGNNNDPRGGGNNGGYNNGGGNNNGGGPRTVPTTAPAR